MTDVCFDIAGRVVCLVGPNDPVGILPPIASRRAIPDTLADTMRPRLDAYYLSGGVLMSGGITVEITTPLSVALARLITEYDRRRAETLYTVPDGPAVTLLPSTAESLLKMLQIAGRLVETGRGSETLWIDDGPTGDVAVTLTAQQIVEHAGAYTDAIAEIEIWAASKKAEIEASAEPLAVSLD